VVRELCRHEVILTRELLRRELQQTRHEARKVFLERRLDLTEGEQLIQLLAALQEEDRDERAGRKGRGETREETSVTGNMLEISKASVRQVYKRLICPSVTAS
jgi:hypothetical protein